MDSIDNEIFNSGTSPQDIAFGNAVRIAIKEIRDDIKDLCAETKQQSTDIAFIRGKLEGKTEKEERALTWKHGAVMTGMGAFLAFLAAKFS